MKRLEFLALLTVLADRELERSCDSNGRPNRYKKAASTRAHSRYLKACEERNVSQYDLVKILQEVNEEFLKALKKENEK